MKSTCDEINFLVLEAYECNKDCIEGVSMSECCVWGRINEWVLRAIS